MKKLGLGSDVDWLTVGGLKVWEDVGREEVGDVDERTCLRDAVLSTSPSHVTTKASTKCCPSHVTTKASTKCCPTASH